MAKVLRPSNKGGPAARQGFKYQDHVAASFILKMLADSNYVQVECETADDIVAVYYRGETLINEYIQVKTTEDEKKWNLDQSTKLDSRKPDTSLFQKSLLCDKRPGDARFRIVSKRDVATVLRCFTVELEKRVLPDEATSRGSMLAKKFPKTLSDQKRDFNYWADNFVWQVCGSIGSLEAMNMKLLFELAEQQGMRPNHSQCKEIYAELLEWTDEAATANVITEAANKVITREQAYDRVEVLFQAAERDAASYAKPYRTKPEPFLVEFHSASDASLLRSLTGFDVQYDFDEWQCREFAEHLVQWLPEFCLRASEIANFQVHHSREVLAKSVGKINGTSLPRERFLAEVILHSILRSKHGSQPIACKVFFEEQGKLSEFGNAHVVQERGRPDELWLGLSRMIFTGKMDDSLDDICRVLDATISKAALIAERNIIVTLREPQHHRPTAEKFNAALSRNTRAEDLLKVLCFPILLAYDSNTLAGGYLAQYIINLKAEVTEHYRTLTGKLTSKIDQVRVVVYLVPIQSTVELIAEFDSICGAYG
ncbi:dsDNA nuclease domain-containing protein [Pseudomonas sp. TNT2022 ID357]|uniref:DsDNA nuclease domain-containing protein n=1 Tax=Pseudomonas idahonensis TaxID=2942628 RepID=A0ABT5Q6J5_9PSED|nr:dsDNA nuclease domain-containing protein [Pseudomonas idahonensis]MDD1149820.1 dsDNA nuclease domain-containing protein [Pseudomonas idahonensis]